MAKNEPQRKETPPGPSPNSPSLLFEYQCRSGKFIRFANRIEKIDSVARIKSNRNFFARIGMLYPLQSALPVRYGLRVTLPVAEHHKHIPAPKWTSHG